MEIALSKLRAAGQALFDHAGAVGKRLAQFFYSGKGNDDNRQRLDAFLVEDERSALRSSAYVRLVFVALLIGLEAVPYLFSPPSIPRDLYAFGIKLGFLPVGAIQLWMARSGAYRAWMKYGLLAADVALLTLYQVVPNPWEFTPASPEFVNEAVRVYSAQTLKWLWLFFVWVSFSFSTNYVRAFGIYVIAAWIAEVVWLLHLPGTTSRFSLSAALGHPGPAGPAGFVDIGVAVDNILVTFFMTLGFIFVAGNNRRLVTRFFAAEERRSALSRYFSPNLVETLANTTSFSDQGLTRAAVLFTDIKGFTTYVQNRTPKEILSYLQIFHGLMESEVFARDGTLEKYIGDAVLAVFGAPVQHDDDAARAFDCALAWLENIDRWNRQRAVRGEPPISIGIGLDYGEVISGIIGRERNMSYAVVGSTVNTASRLEALTRDFDADLVLSDSFYQALRPDDTPRLSNFHVRREHVRIRNMSEQTVWVLNRIEVTAGRDSDASQKQ